jgi:long-subunit fatty acid transport protein
MAFSSSRAGIVAGAIALLVGLFLPGSGAHAQSNGDGSIYSRFGLGSLQSFSSSQSQALGGGGYALRSLNYNPTANPALWSDQVYTRLTAGATYETVSATNGAGASSQLEAGSIEGLQFSFPLYKRTLGVGLSFQPYTQHNYRTQRSGSLPLEVGPDQSASVPYDVQFRGTGGLYSFRGGLGYRVNELLRVGASLDVLFGILERRRNTEFQTDAPARDVRITDATRLAGVSGTLGAHLALADVLQSNDALSLGLAVSLPTTLNGTRVLTLRERQSIAPDTLAAPNGQRSFDGDVTIPWRGRLGVAYQPNTRWTFTVDGLYEPWSSFSSSFPNEAPFTERFPTGGEGTLTDRWRVAVGSEVVPAGEERYAGFLRQIAYRLGAYTERLYVQPDGQTALQTYAATGGFSFPTSLSGTRIDVNVHAGTRGTTEDALVQDRFYGVSLHINFGERWFRERKLR